jgi:uncharacterized membrane protein
MWFYAALGMALISGIYTILSKHTLKRIDPIVFYWAVILFSIPFILPLAIKEGVPELNSTFIVGVVGSVIFYSASKIIFYQVIQKTDLSKVHPLVSLGPIFTLIFSALILSERYTGMEFVAMSITLLGTYVLNISTIREGLLEPFKVLFRNKLALWMLVSVILGGVVSVFDKVAINNTFPQSIAFAILIENIIIIIVFLPWVIAKRKVIIPQISVNKKLIVSLGFLMAGSTLLAFLALGNGDAGLVTSVFRTQVFFVLLFSYLFFKDRPKLETIVGSIIMTAGLILLKLAGN